MKIPDEALRAATDIPFDDGWAHEVTLSWEDAERVINAALDAGLRAAIEADLKERFIRGLDKWLGEP